ncbi:hypothetical protein [Microbacterium timonense]|uniref:hypothetical protein n=1 Tax=Microbacterium timonense TaxID=2086576 RepID=UPI0011B262C8|nr:hypothetical protein [Microbacterium timonense]
MRPTRVLAATVALLCMVPALAGCVYAQGCPGWAGYETPNDAAESAEAVVIGRVVEKVSTTDFNGARANVWSVAVTEWRKGDGPDHVEVLSPPSACGSSADPYLGDEDPLGAAVRHGASALFLVGDEAGWRTISPVQGLVELAPDGRIPSTWPAR